MQVSYLALLRRSNWVAHWGKGAEQLTATLFCGTRFVVRSTPLCNLHTTVDQMGQLHKQCKLSMPRTRCNDVTLLSLLLLLLRQSTHAHQATQLLLAGHTAEQGTKAGTRPTMSLN